MGKLNTDDYRVSPGAGRPLKAVKSDDTGGLDKDQTKLEFHELRERLCKLQEKLYADGRQALLIVLQGMDTSGKDSTIRQVFEGVNPQGVVISNFKAPTGHELAHDFLWRIHQQVPRKGMIGVFNRSHYEDVLIVRVHKLVDKGRLGARYDHINRFERLLHDEGTRMVKFFLHISRDFQKERLQARLADPEKNWKFNPADLKERSCWGEYQEAYEAALSRCSTKQAPWYVVPAEHRWFRNRLIAQVLVDTLEEMNPRYPKADFDAGKVVVE